MKKTSVSVSKRAVLGRKTKRLRKSGTLPATLYGRGIDSVSIELSQKVFFGCFASAGETGVIDLSVDGQTHPVMIHAVQKHPVSGDVLHVEFKKVDLKEKVEAPVPIRLVGEALGVKDGVGILLPLLDELVVCALPTHIPSHVDVDVAGLASVNDDIKAREVALPDGVTLSTEPGVSVVKLGALKQEEEKPEKAEEQPEEVPEAEEAKARGAPEESSSEEGTAPQEKA